MNIPYGDFYKAELGETDAQVDTLTSATKSKTRNSGLAGGSYQHITSNIGKKTEKSRSWNLAISTGKEQKRLIRGSTRQDYHTSATTSSFGMTRPETHW